MDTFRATPSSPRDLTAGDTLARIQRDLSECYVIERELGRGGMATVYLAHDVKHDRRVAVKVLLPDLAVALGPERFRREIQIVSRLSHPHILPVYDSGETNGSLYYVMPFIEGQSLRELLNREQQLSVDDAVRITCQVASALDYAHRQGLVHRDIKPENILLEDGQAIVADFGIARAIAASNEERLTQTGVTLGTPTYMSPEQAVAERNIDGRSDQYSLACVLYEMLAGTPPFVGPMAQVIARHTLGEVPSLTIVRASIPDYIEDAVLRALGKVPADRYPTTGEFAAALSGAPPASKNRRAAVRRGSTGRSSRSRTIAVGAGIAIVLAVIAGVVVRRQLARAEVERAGALTGGLDARRIAVLYFADETKDGHLAFLADALTESLIDELARVRSLQVISRNGVTPFRGPAASIDSVADVLQAGTIVRGAIEDVGDRIRVTVRLIDGNSRAEFRNAGFERPKGDLLAIKDSLADQVAFFLRQRLADEVTLRDDRTGTLSAAAWSLVQQSARARRDAQRLVARDSGAAAETLYRVADSLLAAAEDADPAWATPIVRRAQLAAGQVRSRSDVLRSAAFITDGIAHAERALILDARNAEAYEVRGSLRYTKRRLGFAPDPTESAELLRLAEADLRQATSLDPSRAGAWNALSVVLYEKYNRVEANLAARRAYEEDAYLSAAPDIIWRLFATSYDLEQFVDATQWCERGGKRYPDQARFGMCRLMLMGTKLRRPDVPEAWRQVTFVADRAPPQERERVRREAEILAAVVVARAQLGDSARRVLQRARAGADIDPRGDLLGAEAVARAMINDKEEAIRLLQTYITSHPEHREGFVKANTWWWRSLQDDPRFRALIGVEP